MPVGAVFLAGLLLVAAAGSLGALLGRQALLASEGQRPVVWFRYLRLSCWAGTVCFLVWSWFFIWLLKGTDALALLETYPPPVMLALGLFLLLAPPASAALAFKLASRGVWRVLRAVEWRVGELAAQWFWGLTSLWVPLLLFVGGLAMAGIREFRVAAGMAGAAVPLFFLASHRRIASHGVEHRALDSGELRDRAFELARKAKVPLRGVLILRNKRAPVANAAAAAGRMILLAEDLVRAMPRDELDAVIAHELGHLRHHHVGLVLLAAVVPILLLGWLLSLVPVGFISNNSPILALPGALVVTGFLMRRAEHRADKAASSTIENPEAAIRMLVRLTRLNMLPARWTGWDVKALSHPSLEQRAAFIAGRFQIPASRVVELLQTEPASGESYPLPPALEVSEWAAHRERSPAPDLAVYLACYAIPPVAGAFLTAYVPAIPLWAGLGMLTVLVGVWVPAWVKSRSLEKLRQRVRARLGASGGYFVGLRPAGEPRLYSGSADWDVGIAEVKGPSLRYTGEQAAFEVRAADIQAAVLKVAAPSWFPSKAVCFETCYGSFTLIPLERRGTNSLFREAQTWLSTNHDDSDVESVPPRFPDITSATPREAALSGPIAIVVALVGLSSLAVTAVFAPRWTLMPAVVSTVAAASELLPGIFYRERPVRKPLRHVSGGPGVRI